MVSSSQPAEPAEPAVGEARQRRRSLAAVIVHMLCIGLTLGVSIPLTALILESWHEPGWVIGLAGAMPAGGIVMAMLLAPRFVGQFGSVATMCGGCAIGALALLAMALVRDTSMWLLLRLLMGSGMALPWLYGETWLNTLATESGRGRVIALYAAAFFGGFAAGPLILAEVGVIGWAPFSVAVAALLGAMVPLLLVAGDAPTIRLTAGYRSVWQITRAAPLIMAGAFAAGFSETIVYSLFPVYALRTGLDAAEALTLTTVLIVGGMLLQYPLGEAADRWSRSTVLAGICAATAVIACLLPFAMNAPLLLRTLAFLLGGAVLGIYTLTLVLLGERFYASGLALANAAFMILYQGGSMVGPTLAGTAMDILDPHGLVLVLLCLGAMLGFYSARYPT